VISNENVINKEDDFLSKNNENNVNLFGGEIRSQYKVINIGNTSDLNPKKKKVLPLRWHTKNKVKVTTVKEKDISVIVNKSINLRPGKANNKNNKPNDRSACVSPINRTNVEQNDYNCFEGI
jgi:hypothetical protein